MKVSIIITSYNASATIGRTIESCLNQTYRDLEIIVVDDCSTDGSLDIIKGYEDSRIRIICHDENKGCGYAKRTGLANRSGDFVFFLDCDDYIELDYVQKHLNALIDYDVDVVVSAFRKGRALYGMPHYNHVVMKSERLFAGDYLNTMFAKSSLWDGVEYSTRRIEDLQSRVKMLYNAKRVLILGYEGYHYTQREGSIIHSMSRECFDISVALSFMDILLFLEGKEEIEPKKKKSLYHRIWGAVNTYGDSKEYKEDIDELKAFLKEHSL